MGVNTSKHQYEYSYGDPVNDYYGRSRAMGYTRGASHYGQPAGMMAQGYPALRPPVPVLIPPVITQPMQQFSGQLAGQAQQPPFPQQQAMPQAFLQQQSAMQMPQPQIAQGPGHPPVLPMPMPQMPQPEVNPAFQSQFQQPQAQYPQYSLAPETVREQNPGISGAPLTVSQDSGSSSSSDVSPDPRYPQRRQRRRSNPLEHNPLPAPPREARIPDDYLAGSAMVPSGPPLPRSGSPLKNPLPPPPRDVYKLRKYHSLLVGTAYADREREVFPRGWFSDADGSESGLGRVLGRLNPFRRDSDLSPRHTRSATMSALPVLPEFADYAQENSSSSGGTDTDYTPPEARRSGLGRTLSSRMPFGSRRRNTVPEPGMRTPGMPTPGMPTAGRAPGLAPAPEQPSPLADGQAPPSGFMPMPSPGIPGPSVQPQPAHPPSPMPAQAQPSRNSLNPAFQPQPAHPFSPGSPQPPGMMHGTPGPPMPQPGNPFTPGPSQPQPMIRGTPGLMPQPGNPLTPGPPMPQPMIPGTPGPPMPQPGNPFTPRPPQGAMPTPTPSHPLSPMMPPVVAGEGPGFVPPRSNSDSTVPEISFDESTPGYGGLTHLSPHTVLYNNKLYPTAAHLFEAFRFLGRRNDLAKHVRKAKTLPELQTVLDNIGHHTRPDWEEILIDKMEEALYYKIMQHADLCELLLDTAEAALIYANSTDLFWGEGPDGNGANELGRALERIRYRLRREAEGGQFHD